LSEIDNVDDVATPPECPDVTYVTLTIPVGEIYIVVPFNVELLLNPNGDDTFEAGKLVG
jgi:hypothetical protein